MLKKPSLHTQELSRWRVDHLRLTVQFYMWGISALIKGTTAGGGRSTWDQTQQISSVNSAYLVMKAIMIVMEFG